MAFKGGNKINDLSDKTFSIVAASSGGSTSGGSTGGGDTGGHDGDATEDESTGPPETDEGPDVESTIRITSPSPGQEIETGDAITVSWEATGAARDMDICLKFIQPNGDYGGGGVVSVDASWYGNARIGSGGTAIGEWTLRVSALFEDDTCSATVDNFCSECDNPRSERNFILEAPRVNYCNVTRGRLAAHEGFSEGPVRGDAACQVAVNQWVEERGAGGGDCGRGRGWWCDDYREVWGPGFACHYDQDMCQAP